MQTDYEEIKSVVLGRTVGWNFSEIYLNGAAIELLSAVDGRMTIADLKSKLQLTEAQVSKSYSRLLDLGLVQKIFEAQHVGLKASRKKGVYRGVPFEMAAA